MDFFYFYFFGGERGRGRGRENWVGEKWEVGNME